MITVHHLNNSRSQRVLWLLEELGLEYELKRYQRDPKTMLAPAALREVHPLGKSPVVTIAPSPLSRGSPSPLRESGRAPSGGEGLVLAESGAILEYFVETYARFVPPLGTPDYLRYRYWMHYAEGSAMPPLLLKLVFDRVERAKAPFFVRPIARAIARRAKQTFIEPQIALHLDYLEAELGKSTWFAGEEFTAADIQMSFALEAAAARGGLNSSRPRLMAFLERIHARPAYRRALERGGVFKLG
jgi:glutathione S-transferase